MGMTASFDSAFAFTKELFAYPPATGALVLLLGFFLLRWQVRALSAVLSRQEEKLSGLESAVHAQAGQAPAMSEPPAEPCRDRALRLHALGCSPEEISRQVGVRTAEVDFILRLDQHLRAPAASKAQG
jgi:hypothetical protein